MVFHAKSAESLLLRQGNETPIYCGKAMLKHNMLGFSNAHFDPLGLILTSSVTFFVTSKIQNRNQWAPVMGALFSFSLKYSENTKS